MQMKLEMPSDYEVAEHVRAGMPGALLAYAVIFPVLKVEGNPPSALVQIWDYELAEDNDEAQAMREGKMEDLQNEYGDLGFQLEPLCSVVWVGHVCPRCEFRSVYNEEVTKHIVENH